MAYSGAGTQDSPIAVEDSEDEVIQELEEIHSLSSNASANSVLQDRGPMLNPIHRSYENPPVAPEKKRKRASSFIEQELPVAEPSGRHHPPPLLESRLAQQETKKKAKKRRRKLERQAAEEARLQGLNWLNNPMPFPSTLPQALPTYTPAISWPNQFSMSSVYIPSYPVMTDHAYSSADTTDFYNFYGPEKDNEEDGGFYGQYSLPPSSPPPQASSSNWVSSMAMAVDSMESADFNEGERWSPLSHETPLPPLRPPTPPPPPQPMRPASPKPPFYEANLPVNKPMEHHPRPPKPGQSPQPIGMMPDPDPNSKRGIFIISLSMRDVGTDRHKRIHNYMPNPARTLVIDNLPKTHRTPDFINTWCRTACGAPPVHLFIDTSGAKALIEFSTAELARKAWGSPRLGRNMVGVKTNFIKGQPREDLIRVWWYRVDGVGAGAGVGEIEEGEIEDDAGETPKEEGEHELPHPLPPPLQPAPHPQVETKKEKKARLAREREEKRLRKELKLRALQQERRLLQQRSTASYEGLYNDPPASNPPPSNGFNPAVTQTYLMSTQNFYPAPGIAPPPLPSSIPPPLPAPVATLPISASLLPHRLFVSGSSQPPRGQPTSQSELTVQKTAYGSSLPHGVQGGHDDNDSIASSTGRRSPSPSMLVPTSKVMVASTSGQGDDLDDYEEVDMDVEVDDVPLRPPAPAPLAPVPPLVHGLPPRPMPLIRAPQQRGSVQRPLTAARQPPAPAPSNLAARNPQQQQPAPKLLPPKPPAAQNGPMQLLVERPLPTPATAATMSAAAMTAVSSSSSGGSSPSIPSEPKAMKNAPTQPSFTKRALLARQKELEEKIAKSKMELAAAAASKSGGVVAVPTQPQPQLATPPSQFTKPAMDLGDKQAMEDRLRKLVLQSQKARARPTPPSTVGSTAVSSVPSPSPTPITQSPIDDAPHNEAAQSDSTISISGFSLEDMAISFITQTIETIKAQPPSSDPSALPLSLPPTASPPSTPTPNSGATTPAPVESVASGVNAESVPPPSNVTVNVNSNERERQELAAKQKRLELHISETKALMVALSQARTKEEKESTLKILREKSRLFEEDNRNQDAYQQPPSRPSSTVPTGVTAKVTTTGISRTTTATSATIGKMQSTTTFQFSRVWPGNQNDAGVFILSDDSDDSDDGMEDDKD